MKVFHHYKNKPYKFVGTAKHSESLEEVVIYECLYENPEGQTWVRPKQMFFENVEVDGAVVPRFKEVPVQIETTTDITEEHIQLIAKIIDQALGGWDPDWFHSTFKNRRKFHLALARTDELVLGFKLGYEDDESCFYSWLGGVLPQGRGLGIARSLMKHQHDWCRKQGYEKVRTKTQNKYKEMLILNVKAGFEIIGTQGSATGGLKILFEKKL